MESDTQALDFEGIRRLLERLTFSLYGAEAARALAPAPSLAVARQMQEAVAAARQALEALAVPRLPAIPDIRAALRQAAQPGAALAPTALANVRQVIHGGSVLGVLAAGFSGLCRWREDLIAPAGLVDLLERTVSSAGRLREDASPALAELNQRLKAAREETEAALRRRVAQPDLAALVEEPGKIRWHGSRAVVVVRQAAAEKVKGVRRGTAGGGRDVLIEPLELVALNNHLETLAGKLEAQSQIVLREATDALRPFIPALERLVDAITWVDLALAAARLSAVMGGVVPELAEEPVVELDRAYHPQLLLEFLEKRIPKVEPLTLRLDASQPMLVITGPNTGGKTVVLKTVGLLTTMAHCGLHLPAQGRCVIGGFRRVVVDLGDRQSLYHHLSTFAGHVEVLKRILEEADDRTLVLLDELGTGTDPEEGAALAMAVLDELASRGVRGIVTTHLSPLKGFAESHPYLANASMRFDYGTLTPSYQLECGQAGKSLGLVIAQQRGLPASTLNKARAYLAALRPGA